MVYGYLEELRSTLCMGTHPSFSTMFSKGEILVTVCLPTLKMKSSQNGVTSYGKNIYEFYMGGNYDNDRVASPESVSIHLNESCCIFSTDLFFPLYILYCSHV